ncbi:DUF1295 domain-containing protein [Candidatus Dojkabacteria bacterium]|uniref:DUF1295 domain-containing protein n=1 Tax=Candidatus Dojkabacteria bacterium TaxID=2099670 RepID=A0A955L8N5_9BACT|nr:DUF1295 domain-containing protein [Candidatus Dojkabacteria bacterium]
MITDLYSAVLTNIAIFFGVVFALSIILKRNDIVDVAWGLGFVVIGSTLIYTQEGSLRYILLFGLILTWGMRLAMHILFRLINKKGKEDFRYAQWREEWGSFVYVRSFFQIYVLQALLMLVISSPLVIVIQDNSSEITLIHAIGGFVALIGLTFEALGDYQLSRFKSKKENKGKLMTTGLWSLTRHPNYFGEVTFWWGVFIFTLPSEFGGYAIVSALTITFLILGVSGIPMLEKKYEGNKDFEEYKKETNAFWPGL